MGKQPLNLLDQSVPASKIILHLAWPTVVEQILQTLVNYVDTAMVGSLGAEATAAIAINNSLIWLINGLMNAAAIGFSVQIAREIGVGNLEQAKKVIRQAIIIMLFGGVGLTLLIQLIASKWPIWLGADAAIVSTSIRYLRIIASVYLFNIAIIFVGSILRGSGDTKTPLVYNLLSNVLNVMGNFLLIFPKRNITFGQHSFTIWGAGLGVEGAALATAFAFLVSGILMLGVIFIKKSKIRIKIKENYCLDKSIMWTAWRLGSPAAYERIILSSGQLVLTKMIAGLGTTSLAAYFLTNTAEAISYLPGFGFSVAATTLVAQSLGAEEKQLAQNYSRLCIRYGVIMMSLSGVILFVFSHQLISLFSPDPQVISLGSTGLKIMALSEPFFALSIVINGILRGAGDSKWPFYITACGMWGVRIMAIYILSYILGLGVYGAWLAMVLDMMVRGVLSLWRYRSNKWLHVW